MKVLAGALVWCDRCGEPREVVIRRRRVVMPSQPGARVYETSTCAGCGEQLDTRLI